MKRFDIEVYGGRAYLVGNPAGKYVTHDDALESITALFDVTAQRNQLLAVLEGLAEDVQGLIAESHGVAGMHLNGDVAPWHELEAGGRFERLTNLPAAFATIAAVKGAPC